MTANGQKEDIWETIDNHFRKTMHLAEQAYRTNYTINLIIVLIGIIFLGSSLYFSYTRGIDISTLTYAGLGIADFVALFLVNPQRRIQQLIGDLSQIVVIYRTWKSQLTLTESLGWSEQSGKIILHDFEGIKNFNTELNRITEASLNAIEKYIGTEPSKKSSNQSLQK